MSFLCQACKHKRPDDQGASDADLDVCDNCVMIADRVLAFRKPESVPMLLTCPGCGQRHIDAGVFATTAHHTHACQHCGMCWRPAVVPTVGVRFLPGFKNT
jgi:hypothetical protein